MYRLIYGESCCNLIIKTPYRMFSEFIVLLRRQNNHRGILLAFLLYHHLCYIYLEAEIS